MKIKFGKTIVLTSLRRNFAVVKCRWCGGTKPTPSLPSVANGGFAPLCGAAATPVAALKTPVARREGGLNSVSRGYGGTRILLSPEKNTTKDNDRRG